MSITGVVHTKNEERNIARALRSLQGVCDELLVADMNSTDRTREIAASFGARVLPVPDFGYADPAWALALAEVGTEWVLRIDADEIVPPRLGARLRDAALADEADVVDVGRRNFMFGHPLVGTGWGPESDRHFFCFKPRHLEQVAPDATKVHTIMRPLETARVLRLPLEDDLVVWHFNYLGWDHFVSKMNRYTSIEAAEMAADGAALSLGGLLVQLARQTGKRGLMKQAWRDGYRGGGLLWMMATYRVLTYLKSRQLRDVGDAEAILRRYDTMSDELLR